MGPLSELLAGKSDPWNQLYNTSLSPVEEQQYQLWVDALAKSKGWDKSGVDYDYDMRGYWNKYKDNFTGDSKTGHFTDEFKKPNHPTFSNQSIYSGANGNEGGSWLRDKDGRWTFVPSSTNLKMHSVDFLNNYFSRVEPGNDIEYSSLLG